MAWKVTGTSEVSPVEIGVTWQADVVRARELSRALAASIGFPEEQCHEAGLVATELASNLIRHASGGTIILRPVGGSESPGIEIRSIDEGPGISDVETAITDGYSTAGGLGIGLGTVNRLMDDLEIFPGPKGGLEVVCRRWLRARHETSVEGPAFGSATRSYRGIAENGDAFIFRRWEKNALAGVIDGLGHGPFAQRAAQTARHYIEQHFDQPLENLFRGTDRACRATRGVVMALARFDLTRRTVTIASVGNIETRLLGGAERFDIVVRRGIIGLNAPNPVLSEHPWASSSVLIMHSDGLASNWDWRRFSEFRNDGPNVIARRLLMELGRPDDDATVIVARSAQ